MSAGDTIRPVARPRGVLTQAQKDSYDRIAAELARVEADRRDFVVYLLNDGCSFSEVSKATGLSTNTLQRWKREAGK